MTPADGQKMWGFEATIDLVCKVFNKNADITKQFLN